MNLNLSKWFESNEVLLSSAIIIRDTPNGKRIEARKSISSSTVIGTVSKNAILSRRTTSLKVSNIIDSNPSFVLAFILLNEIALGKSSKWFEYIESLPKSVPIALFWKSEAIKWIQGTELGSSLSSSSLVVELEIFYKSNLHLLSPSSPTLVDFHHAFSLVSSRAFIVDSFHHLSLVPFADIFNHSFENNVEVQVDYWVCTECGQSSNCDHDEESEDELLDSIKKLNLSKKETEIELILIESIEAGEEIFNSYGALGNSRLLMEYGFALEANESDWIQFSLTEISESIGFKNCNLYQNQVSNGTTAWKQMEKGNPENELVHDEETEGDQYNINSEAALSRSLWIILALCGRNSLVRGEVDLSGLDRYQNKLLLAIENEQDIVVGVEEEDFSILIGSMAALVIRLCKARINKEFEPQITGFQVLDLAEIEREEEVRLAMRFAADERMNLECVISKWSQMLL